MHAPKSILLHLDNSPRCVERIKLAKSLAEQFDAEVTAIYATMPYLMRYPIAMEGGTAARAMVDQAAEQARETARQMFDSASEGSPLMTWVAPATATTPDPTRDFIRRAFYCDLMILGQYESRNPTADTMPPGFLPDLMIQTGKPALVVPFVGRFETFGRNVLVAWKESREASTAVTAALPWLRSAAQVHVVAYSAVPSVPSQALQAYLAEQGVRATLHHGGPGGRDIGEKILSLAADLNVDLLVMGSYGHSRAREWVLGGATRSIFESMTVPVLMAH